MQIEARLIKKGKVVGYELWHKGLTYHCETEFKSSDIETAGMLETSYRCDFDNEAERNAYLHNVYHIPHDRKDLFTGITLKDGVKVYERDEYYSKAYDEKYIVQMNRGEFRLFHTKGLEFSVIRLTALCEKTGHGSFEFIGIQEIEGVEA